MNYEMGFNFYYFQYLLFTMILVTFSVVVTIGVLNVNFRTPATHKMAPWVRKAFIDFLPRYLFIKRPDAEPANEDTPAELNAGKYCFLFYKTMNLFLFWLTLICIASCIDHFACSSFPSNEYEIF